MFSAIPSQCLPIVWESVAPLLQKVVDRSTKDCTLEDLYRFISTRDMQLWVWTEDTKITACCVTQIVDYPRRKICRVPYVAGKMYKKWIHCEDKICEWARQNDCSQLEGFCRRGWLDILNLLGWKEIWVTMRKDI